MQKIVFRNNLPPALNDTNLNQLQNNIETAINEKVSPSDLATVATTGNYNDLINIPPSASVNNSTITIKKNGVAVDSFTTNASSNKDIDIPIPTKLSDFATVLYDGTATSGNVTLSQNASNFNYLIIYYGNSNGDNRKAEIVYSPNGKMATLTMNNYYKESASNFYQYYYSKRISISGTTITDVQDWELRMLNRTVSNATQDKVIYIYRVEGYK